MENDNSVEQNENRDIPTLILCLASNDPEIKKDAAKALGDLNATEANTALLRLLEDEDSHVRLQAAQSLGNIKSPESVQGLIQSLSDIEKYVRWSSAEALGKIGNTLAIDPLIIALNDKNRLVRKDVVKALSEFDDDSARKALEEYRQSGKEHKDGVSGNEFEKFVEIILFGIISGLVSGAIGYYSYSTFSSQGLTAWIVCYVLFMRNLEGFSQTLAIFITIALTLRGGELLEIIRTLTS